jgi:type VI secretion system protein ImpM
MSEIVTAGPKAVLDGAALGFCGKLPARGDFVGAGLPRHFVEPWHDWLQRSLAESRGLLGVRWVSAWLEAPVWRFALPSGLCGPDPVLGLWMPSVDRVGRHFPLTLAAVLPGGETAALLDGGAGFLAAAEAAGLDALSSDLPPDALLARVTEAAAAEIGEAAAAPAACPAGAALWWSAGSPRVPAVSFVTTGLPDGAAFARMLDAGAAAGPPEP